MVSSIASSLLAQSLLGSTNGSTASRLISGESSVAASTEALLRQAILQPNAAATNVSISGDLAQFIADNVDNPAISESLLADLQAISQLSGRDATDTNVVTNLLGAAENTLPSAVDLLI